MTVPGRTSEDICTVNLNSWDAPGASTGVTHETRLAVPGGGTEQVVGNGGTVPPVITPTAGMTSLDVTFSAVPGPTFGTGPTYSATPPGATPLEPESVSARSALSGMTSVDTEDELFPGAGSDTAELTLAVLTNVGGPEKSNGTCKSMRVVLTSPGSSDAIVHGNPAAHGPLPPANVRPAGSGSENTTFGAVDCPRLVLLLQELAM